MKEICALALCLLLTLCSATSPPFPSIIPLDCNATQLQVDLATDLINEDRDEGFVFKPVRIESVFQQESEKVKGGFVYYIDFDVAETECSVLSGKNWKECNKDIPFHEQVFGHCKAIIFIARPWRILKLLNYNCTLSTVPSRTIVQICPDCPTLVSDITNDITAKAHHLVEKFNKESNETRYFKTDEIERVRLQWVFGASYFFKITIKETECLKTQADVNIAECKFLKDNEAHVGFCTGGSYTTAERTESFYVNCEIFDPRDDDKHEHCGSGQDSSKLEKEGKNENADPKGPGEEGPDHHRHRHGRKHHRCHPDHHHQHHEHPHRHHHHEHPHRHHHHEEHPHHRHHHHHHLNDTHHHHGKSHDHHNHTHEHGSSSEENNDNKPHEKPSKGSVQIYFNPEDPKNLPTPTIFRLPPQPGHKRKHKYDSINFPSEHSPLATCPGEPLVDLPVAVKDILFAKLPKKK